jgi:proline iminopeptidase
MCFRRMSTSKLYIDPAHVAAAEEDEWAKYVFFRRASLTQQRYSPDISTHPSAFARIENHYFINDGFMREGQLLDIQEIDKM